MLMLQHVLALSNYMNHSNDISRILPCFAFIACNTYDLSDLCRKWSTNTEKILIWSEFSLNISNVLFVGHVHSSWPFSDSRSQLLVLRTKLNFSTSAEIFADLSLNFREILGLERSIECCWKCPDISENDQKRARYATLPPDTLPPGNGLYHCE